MATIVITGGTDGLGRALALHYLDAGQTVVVVGRSRAKFEALAAGAVAGTAHFVAADLTLVAENKRVVETVTRLVGAVDVLILCAAYARWDRVETAEGFEHTFALYYLSRALLVTGLRPGLVLNTSVPGAARDAIPHDDLQLREGFAFKTANQLSRRANELLGLHLAQGPGGTRHILYSPGFVRSSHAGSLGRFARLGVTVMAALLGTPPAKAAARAAALLADPPAEPHSAFDRDRRVELGASAEDVAEAEWLWTRTRSLTEPHG
ncbi:SDR family NAD(P)-dependent oxidoreductase [Phytomonospora sp. NPDC050363]|uniref:SDR family NAD(P)-dependent oxidoreductase n=1 Tax=Phytomonospora sp. NPDC050363 TaxID=3155642 RepID=UPI0033D36B41